MFEYMSNHHFFSSRACNPLKFFAPPPSPTSPSPASQRLAQGRLPPVPGGAAHGPDAARKGDSTFPQFFYRVHAAVRPCACVFARAPPAVYLMPPPLPQRIDWYITDEVLEQGCVLSFLDSQSQTWEPKGQWRDSRGATVSGPVPLRFHSEATHDVAEDAVVDT
jgi:hypothetical protein